MYVPSGMRLLILGAMMNAIVRAKFFESIVRIHKTMLNEPKFNCFSGGGPVLAAPRTIIESPDWTYQNN